MYDHLRNYFALLGLLCCPILFLINAPFGRFSPKNQNSVLLINGKIAWILMESAAPVAFLFFSVNSPGLLPLLFLTHYLNRAFISPLRTPSRSKSHLVVPLAAILFNLINAYLLASFFNDRSRPPRPPAQFYVGILLWFIGFAGNIWHDEVLLNLRRSAANSNSNLYAIPNGGLYALISFPNYFCEWLEWFGFALASSPVPLSFSLAPPPQGWAPDLTPPWIFFFNEILLMLPRAYRGHQWYKQRFGDSYPKDRKAIIPFIL